MSPEARDFIDRLLCFDPAQRLGAKGAEEVKRHPFLADIDWANVRTTEANFVPQVNDPESTDYFDARGADSQVFEDDPAISDTPERLQFGQSRLEADAAESADISHQSSHRSRNETVPQDFGAFDFKNLDVLKSLNDDVIRKLRSDALLPSASDAPAQPHQRRHSNMGRPMRSSSGGGFGKVCHKPLQTLAVRGARGADTLVNLKGGPPSPSNSTTSSSVSVPSLPNTPFGQPSSGHRRRPSDQHIVQKLKPPLNLEDDVDQASRRNSMPGRLRRASFSTNDRRNMPGDAWHQRRQTSGYSEHTPASSVSSPSSSKVPLPQQLEASDVEKKASPKLPSLPAGMPSEKTVDCLIAEDSKCCLRVFMGSQLTFLPSSDPISSKILETILVRLGCLCVVVHNGEEAIRCSMGEITFDVIFMDMLMPICESVRLRSGGRRTDMGAVSFHSGRRKCCANDQVYQQCKPEHSHRRSDVVCRSRQDPHH